MQKWEYLTVRCETVSGRTIPQRMNGQLLQNWKENPPYEVFFNQLGEQGWEFQVLLGINTFMFKRPKQELSTLNVTSP